MFGRVRAGGRKPRPESSSTIDSFRRAKSHAPRPASACRPTARPADSPPVTLPSLLARLHRHGCRGTSASTARAAGAGCRHGAGAAPVQLAGATVTLACTPMPPPRPSPPRPLAAHPPALAGCPPTCPSTCRPFLHRAPANAGFVCLAPSGDSSQRPWAPGS